MSPPEESAKFKLRKAKVRELERQQELEDAAHLGMSAEEHALLQATFVCVHAEFEDLDGMSWASHAAQGILREWKRKKALQIISAGRQKKGLPALCTPSLRRSRSSSRSRSSGGFTMPALARTRPSIPVALLDGPRPLMQPGPRFAKILDREANRTQFRDEEDDWLDNDNLDEKLSSAIRSIAEPMDQTQEQRIASVRQCATLGRSWRGGLKTRNAIPAPFYTVRGPRKERRSTHLERYFDSGGQDTEPLSSAFSSYDAGIDDDDQETVRGEELGGQGRTVDYDQDEASASFHDSTPGGNEAEPGQRTTTTGECATTVETTVVSTKALPVPPPIIAASPRLGGSASALWGTDGGGQRAAGSPTLGSVRMGRGKRRSAAMGSPTSPRVVSFHRERCGIAVCNSARKRAGPTDVVA